MKLLAAYFVLVFTFSALGQDDKNPNVELPDFVITGKDVIVVRRVDKIPADVISTVSEEFLKPILAKLDDQSQLAFEVERTDNGYVVVYLPGAPDTKSGNVVYLTDDRVEPLDIDFKAITSSLRKLGKGSSTVIENRHT